MTRKTTNLQKLAAFPAWSSAYTCYSHAFRSAKPLISLVSSQTPDPYWHVTLIKILWGWKLWHSIFADSGDEGSAMKHWQSNLLNGGIVLLKFWKNTLLSKDALSMLDEASLVPNIHEIHDCCTLTSTADFCFLGKATSQLFYSSSQANQLMGKYSS